MSKIWHLACVAVGLTLLTVGCDNGTTQDTSDIRVGTLSPLTGAGALYGKKLTQAVDLAFAEINQAGGINGRKLVAIHEDSKLEPKSAVSGAQKLISVNKVPVIIGAVASSSTLAAAPVAEKNKVVLITPISSADKISDAGDYVFRIAPPDSLQARDAAQWIHGCGFSKVAVLYINNDYGVGLKERFVAEFKKLGGTVVATEGFAQGAKDFRSQLTKIKQADPKAVFVPSYMEEAGRVLRQRKELGLKAQVFGTDPFHDPLIFEGAGDAADGVWFMDVASGSGSVFDAFAKKYKTKYSMDAEIIAAESYDAALAIIKAIKAAGSADPAAVKDALYKLKADGASGRIEFDQKGDIPTKRFQRFAIKGKEYVAWEKPE